MDTKPLGVSEALWCGILCLGSELVSQVAPTQVYLKFSGKESFSSEVLLLLWFSEGDG